MLISAVDDETYCPRTQTHVPCQNGKNLICYRCGMLLGTVQSPDLGSLMDY